MVSLRLGVLALAVASAGFAGDGRAELTPDGPATLMTQWHGAVTMEGPRRDVLTGARVTVGPGGRGGGIWLRVVNHSSEKPVPVIHVRGPFAPPAKPGTYTFPLPHEHWDYRDGDIGIVQETGGHALIARDD